MEKDKIIWYVGNGLIMTAFIAAVIVNYWKHREHFKDSFAFDGSEFPIISVTIGFALILALAIFNLIFYKLIKPKVTLKK